MEKQNQNPQNSVGFGTKVVQVGFYLAVTSVSILRRAVSAKTKKDGNPKKDKEQEEHQE